MPLVPHLSSIAAVAEQARTKEHFRLGYLDFLDGFYAMPSASAIADEPILLRQSLQDDGYADAFLGALAEHLAYQFKLFVPAWCRTSERTLEMPSFAYKTPEGRIVFAR